MNTTAKMLEIVEPRLARGEWVRILTYANGHCDAKGGPIHTNGFEEQTWSASVRTDGTIIQSPRRV